MDFVNMVFVDYYVISVRCDSEGRIRKINWWVGVNLRGKWG